MFPASGARIKVHVQVELTNERAIATRTKVINKIIRRRILRKSRDHRSPDRVKVVNPVKKVHLSASIQTFPRVKGAVWARDYNYTYNKTLGL